MKEYRTDYQIVHWADTTELAALLNKLVNQGWRVDNHKLDHNSATGWTIFSKTTLVKPNMMEALMPLRELWRIMSSTPVFNAASIPLHDAYHNPVADEITKQVKEYYEKNAKEMQ
jgi:hypothetical protein